MPTRIVEDSGPSTTVVEHGNSGTGVLVATLVGLIIIAVVVLVILHATLGVA